jgi:hypothetical protein
MKLKDLAVIAGGVGFILFWFVALLASLAVPVTLAYLLYTIAGRLAGG